MYKAPGRGLLLLLLLTLYASITMATPPGQSSQSGSSSAAKSHPPKEIQKQLDICKAMKPPVGKPPQVNKRVVDVEPIWPIKDDPIYALGCTTANILWTDDERASELSEWAGHEPLGRDVVYHESLASYWTRKEAPADAVEMFHLQNLQRLCTVLAQMIPNNVVGSQNFFPFPNGYSVLVGYVNDRRPPHEAPPREVTGAVDLFMFNIKHGYIVIHATSDPVAAIMKKHKLVTAQAESHAAIPGTLSGLLASEWQLQHRSQGVKSYYSQLRLDEAFVFNSIKKLHMIVLPSIRGYDDLIGLVMACVGFHGQGAGGSIPDFDNAKQFMAGSYCYNMLLGTEPTRYVAEFLYEHRQMLGRKVITAISVFSREPADQPQHPTLLLSVEDYTEELGQKWIAEQLKQT